ncbi:hypothetical protein FSP39_007500 [Pinctada imbricata]|uniref:Integrase catalytic domain-containing protein n=1 Tax=Pinctada imbricata TaxID=66713 RepID=A0AA88XCS1_PINIB|nr:hypothetical protein FSP39_007500 [Pinctada imbricata]
MELCAAVLAIEMADTIKEHLELPSCRFRYYSDSQIVLGYITNESRRFYVFVSNRVSRIRASSSPDQWRYISSAQNPADLATRSISASNLQDSIWFKGPDFLYQESQPYPTTHPLIDPDSDKEVRPIVTCAKAKVTSTSLGSERLSNFSTWNSLLLGIATLQSFIKRQASKSETKSETSKLESLNHAEKFVISLVQSEVFSEEILCIKNGISAPRNSSLLPLNPIIGPDGLLRVGGRIRHAKDVTNNPIIIPKHHIALLLTRHFHSKVAHQGRHITEGAIRNAGFWILGCKRLIASVISKCVMCRRLRGKLGWQKMSDLPKDRLDPGPPFTNVGIDNFGPWQVVSRRTRGGSSNQKRWAILFTCLVTRGVHIELIEELSSASFINALRRFVSIRGPVSCFRSDRGTNFIGATGELQIDTTFVEKGTVGQFLRDNGSKWMFNPPHASHFGGVWERMIGSCRRILDSLLLNHKAALTHEVLSTFMLEVCAILNAPPLLPVPTDSGAHEILSPAMLLTHKRTLPESPVLEGYGTKDALRSAWKCVQQLADNFWTRWRTEYLRQLQSRQKWHTPNTPYKEGDVVLIKDSEAHRNTWPLGLITRVFVSDDNHVRKVEIRRAESSNLLVRPVSQLVRLVEFE